MHRTATRPIVRTTRRSLRPTAALRLLPALPLVLLLSACGGGGGNDDTSGGSTAVSDSTVQAMSANSSVAMEDGTEAATTLVTTTETVVAAGSAGQTITCPGGGSASYSVTGAPLATLVNGQLDAGEVYSLSFSACRSSSGSAALDGSATLTVTAASTTGVTVQTSTSQLQTTLPQRVLTLNGTSTVALASSSNGTSTTTSAHWSASQITLTSVRNARTSTLQLGGVDLTRSVTSSAGVVSATSSSGTCTVNATLPNGSWSMTLATQGAVSYDSSGVPTQGAWTITLPYNRIGVSISPASATLSVDHGADGSIDRTITLTPAELAAQAG